MRRFPRAFVGLTIVLAAVYSAGACRAWPAGTHYGGRLRQAVLGADGDMVMRQWTVDGVTREAMVYLPPSTATRPAPVLFAFHGHGGTCRNAARRWRYDRLWPDAIVVYMQGLPTPGSLIDPEGRLNGWQNAVGVQGDRDLHFFDAVLSSLRRDYHVDDKRVYVTGHSNGGGFTYLLWAERGDLIAAVAPAAAIAFRNWDRLKPKPAMHIAGEYDQLVRFRAQRRTMDFVRRLNGCESEGRPWARFGALTATLYESRGGTPFVEAIYPGPHSLPDEAPALIVKFFKEQAAKTK